MDEKKIPEFTKNDFLYSSKPYEWLDENSSNKFEALQLTERMNDLALSVKIRNFKTLYKEYLSAKDGNTYGLNATNFTGQEFSLNCGDWSCDDYGVTIFGRNGAEEIACTHPIMPVQRLYNIDSGTEKLKIAYKKGQQWRSMIVDKKTLSSNTSIIGMSQYGVAVNSENSRLLVRYIADIEALNYDKIPEISSVGRLGWIRDYEFSPYVDSLVFDGDEKCRHFFESVKESGSREKWFEIIGKIRSGTSIPARITLAAAFASVLVKPCEALPFFVHLWNSTGKGKTVALFAAASVWGSPSLGDFTISFNSTGVGKEELAVAANSLPLVIDELQIAKSEKDLDKLIYELTEGVGRLRGAKDGGIRKTGTWCNCILTSGEMPLSKINSGGGAVNRILDIECDSDLFEDPIEVVGIVKKNYGFAGREFVKAISNDEIMDEIRVKQREYMKILQQSESTDKQAVSASIILTADFFAERFIFHDGYVLTPDEISPFLATKSDVSQELHAYEQLMDEIAMNANHFIPNANENAEIWGAIDTECAYIICSKFNSIVLSAGYNPSAVLSWLKNNNLIETEDGRKTKCKKINKINRRCVWLRLDNVTDLEDKFVPYQGKVPFED